MELFNSLIMLVSTNVAICGRLKQSKNLLQKLFVSDYFTTSLVYSTHFHQLT
jgi:hypothetical protein